MLRKTSNALSLKLTSSAPTEKNGRLKHNRQQQEQFIFLLAD